MSNYLLISDAAKEVKVESHVLRYWEEELHLPIKRNELGHRYYTEEDVERFKQIKSMKERGLQLKAIKMILKNGKLNMMQGDDQSLTPMNVSAQNLELSEEEKFTSRLERQTQKRAAEQYAPQLQYHSAYEEEIASQSKEEKNRRLQWLLQQLIRETLQENNEELSRTIRECVVKELDYQFRLQEERDDERERILMKRNEEYYKKMDELLRMKSQRMGKRIIKQQKNAGSGAENEKRNPAQKPAEDQKKAKKKRHSLL